MNVQNSKRLVLTGVTGKKSGGAFIEQLSMNRDSIRKLFPEGIRIIVRGSSDINRINTLFPDAEIMVGSFDDKEFLQNSFMDADTIVHIAGIQRSRQVVDAAALCHVRRLIMVHTTGIYSKYKAAGEEYRKTDEYVYDVCHNNGMILTLLRPTMIYGNIYDKNVITFIRMVDKLPIMPVVNHARYELQPVHYTDLGKAFFQVLMNEKTTADRDFILSGGKPILLRDMLMEIGKNLDKKVRFVSVPFPLAYVGAWGVYCATLGKQDFREKVQRLCEPRVFSHEDARIAFGYDPMDFEQGIVDEVREYKKSRQS